MKKLNRKECLKVSGSACLVSKENNSLVITLTEPTNILNISPGGGCTFTIRGDGHLFDGGHHVSLSSNPSMYYTPYQDFMLYVELTQRGYQFTINVI